MKTYEAKVTVEYIFTFESESTSRKELKEIADNIWSDFCSLGYEGDHYHDTEISVREY